MCEWGFGDVGCWARGQGRGRRSVFEYVGRVCPLSSHPSRIFWVNDAWRADILQRFPRRAQEERWLRFHSYLRRLGYVLAISLVMGV